MKVWLPPAYIYLHVSFRNVWPCTLRLVGIDELCLVMFAWGPVGQLHIPHVVTASFVVIATRLLCRDLEWNFCKFLIDKNGQPVKRYASTVPPFVSIWCRENTVDGATPRVVSHSPVKQTSMIWSLWLAHFLLFIPMEPSSRRLDCVWLQCRLTGPPRNPFTSSILWIERRYECFRTAHRCSALYRKSRQKNASYDFVNRRLNKCESCVMCSDDGYKHYEMSSPLLSS